MYPDLPGQPDFDGVYLRAESRQKTPPELAADIGQPVTTSLPPEAEKIDRKGDKASDASSM